MAAQTTAQSARDAIQELCGIETATLPLPQLLNQLDAHISRARANADRQTESILRSVRRGLRMAEPASDAGAASAQ
jgi:hypothetical protein